MPHGPNRKAIIFLVVVAFLNTMGMTIISPVVPFMTLQHLSNPNDLAIVVAWLTSIYGVCQLIAAPGLGLLSDRFGRRPILFICLLGSAIGYLLFGLGGSLWILFLGRIIDGLTGGNFSVLFAYIADITEPE
ncbi:MAG: MFS transporter, partial [Chloroflexota bacterium]|nr:MFS transporter [Chloroflexota bacterium]